MNNTKISLHTYDIEEDIAKIDSWEIPNSEKRRVVEFIREFISGRVSKRIPTKPTAHNFLNLLRPSLEAINKESPKLTKEDIIVFSDNLSQDKLTKNIQGQHKKSSNPYKEPVKLRIKYALSVYLKHILKGDSMEFIDILKIKPKIKKPSIDFLTEDKIIKLLGGCKNDEERFLIGILFDSGLRAEEFYNIRKENIELSKDNKFYRIHIGTEHSKTKGRLISLTWYKSFEIVHNYLEQRKSEGIKDNEPIFKMKYRTAREFLYRLGERVLGRKLYFHLFRHSSATYYASKLNRQQLCYRYGWDFSSDMVDTYINREGVDMNEIEEKFENQEKIKIVSENNQLKTEVNVLKERLDTMENLLKRVELWELSRKKKS